MLHGLRSEGSEPPVVLWSLAREIRTLLEAQLDCDKGQNAQKALSTQRVWPQAYAVYAGCPGPTRFRIPLFVAGTGRRGGWQYQGLC